MSSIPPRLPRQDKTPAPNGANGKNSNQPKRPSFFNQFLSTLLIFFILVSAYTLIVSQNDDMEQISLSQLASDVAAGQIESIEVNGQDITATYQNDIKRTSHTELSASLSETLVNYGVTPDELRNVDIDIKSPSGFSYWFFNLAPFLIPILFIGFFIWFLSRQVKGAGMQAFTFGQSRARFIDPNDKAHRVTFKDVAGVKEAKQELVEIVDFLKNPKKFLDLGARIPKGVILMGAPGTGKTLLARAVAGEANVPFFSISGSEFVEMFVGVGASRVRDLFKIAKKAAPAIIFVDEIDAVGRTRGGGVGGGNDEREQTLNQILVEMDGFEPNEKVIVMAATNRPDVLDPALLRPGRFDRRVVIDTPDIEDREEILKIQTEQKPKKPLADDVDLRRIAERTPGFSGADLYSLVNEAAIITAREDRKQVTQDDFINAIEKVMLGPERRSHLLSKREREITAYHEAGHALVASVLEHSHPVHKISIVSRGRAAGYTLHLPLEEKSFRSRKEFLDDLAVTLAGYATELLVFDDVTTGPSNDLQVATARARDMVTKYGMSDEIGPIALESDTGKALYGKGIGDNEYSERIAAEIDREVSRIIHTARERAQAVLVEHRDFLNAIAKHLVEKETIERDEFEDMLRAHNIHVKTLDKDADEPSLFIGPEPPEPTTDDEDMNL